MMPQLQTMACRFPSLKCSHLLLTCSPARSHLPLARTPAAPYLHSSVTTESTADTMVGHPLVDVDTQIQNNPVQLSPKGKYQIGFGFFKIHY
jgi:hypothetical protein